MSIIKKAISPSQTKKKKPSSRNRRRKNGSPDRYSDGSPNRRDGEVNKEAIQLDKENGNTKWADAEAKEIDKLNSLHSFWSIGMRAPTPKGYKKIPIFFVYVVKETGRFKARLVAGVHVLPPPIHSVYSGVVSL